MGDLFLESTPGTYTHKGAIISKCGRYRYRLWREWCPSHADYEPKALVFIMLNPSTADGDQDDPTIRRCVTFAKREGYERLEVLNLFAHRATSPKALLALNDKDDPYGPENQYYFDQVVWGNRIVCAWGAHGAHLGQDETVKGWLPDKKWYCLGRTDKGFPRHPLYVPGNQELEVYS